MILYLVRHAVVRYDTQVPYNVLPGPPLAEDGMVEAAETADVLEQCGIQRVISSPMRRCVMTADHIGRLLNFEPALDDDLGEVQPGEKPVEMALRLMRAALTHGTVPALALVSHAAPLEEFMLAMTAGRVALSRPDNRGARIGTGHVWQLLQHAGTWHAQRVVAGGVLV
ncbi:MAG: histidine phosphatase family protein [Chloroflexota bacterium]|nr:histidine phosphatase family protein [Chloroflexota bacterium]